MSLFENTRAMVQNTTGTSETQSSAENTPGPLSPSLQSQIADALPSATASTPAPLDNAADSRFARRGHTRRVERAAISQQTQVSFACSYIAVFLILVSQAELTRWRFQELVRTGKFDSPLLSPKSREVGLFLSKQTVRKGSQSIT